jgi:hypothetical protein
MTDDPMFTQAISGPTGPMPVEGAPIVSMVSAPELGVPPLPNPPMQPALPAHDPPRGLLQQLIRSLPGIAGGLMGPGAGTGLLQGTVVGEDRLDQLERQRYHDALDAYGRQQTAYNQQLQQHEIAQRQRENLLQSNLTNLRNQLKAVRTSGEYDQYVAAYANGLRLLGFRVDDRWLRSAVGPFVPVNEREQAGAMWDQLLKNPITAKTFEQNPDAVLNGSVDVDLNGDGTPERLTLAELGLKGNRLLQDVNGKPIVLRQNTPVSGDRFAQARENGLRIFRETNRREPTAAEDRKLLEDAITFARIGSSSEFDEYVSRREAELGRKLTATEYRTARQGFRDVGGDSASTVQRQARQALKVALLSGRPIPPSVINQLRTAGLEPEAEIADVRREFIGVGRQFSEYPEASTPDELFQLGIQALRSGQDLGAATTTDPNPPAPVDPAVMESLRAVFPGRRTTPAAMQPAPAPAQKLTPGARYRWTPQGLVPVQ